MKLHRLLSELHRRNPVLSITGWIHLILLVGALVGMLIDTRTILGINPWIKPAKFMMSITIFVWTMGWLLESVKARYPRSVSVITWAVAVSMIIEIICISLQSLRGVPSHFNISTPFDGAVFGIMGLMIVVNSLAALGTLVLFCTRLELDPIYQAAICLGLVLFLVGSFWGRTMVTCGAHAVGVPDGGPGLPVLNWSTEAGDLRVAHSLGLHALQHLPLAGFFISRTKMSGLIQWTCVTVVFGLYTTAMIFTYNLATNGTPLIRGG